MLRSASPHIEGAELTEPTRPGTKKALLFEMLGKPGGASIPELVAAMGWKPNTIHSVFATMRRQGVEVSCEQNETGRRYRIHDEGIQ